MWEQFTLMLNITQDDVIGIAKYTLIWGFIHQFFIILFTRTEGNTPVKRNERNSHLTDDQIRNEKIDRVANNIMSFTGSFYINVVAYDIIYNIDKHDLRNLKEFGHPNEPHHLPMLYAITGYMFYSTYWELVQRNISWVMVIHHVVSIVAMGQTLGTQTCAREVAVATLYTEITTPLLCLKGILKHYQLNKSILGKINDFCFAITFLIFRNGWAWPLTYKLLTSKSLPILQVSGALLFCLCQMWGIHLLYKGYKMLFVKKKKSN